MSTQIQESDAKILSVVFESKNFIVKTNYPRESKLESPFKRLAAEITKNTLRKKIAVIYAEFDKATAQKSEKIAHIVDAVRKANRQESLITEKFVGDVESMVARFKIELDKMQELFGNIIKNLPPLEVEQTAVTKFV